MQPHCDIVDEQIDRLREAALLARKRAYAPYSNFLVGAAILTDSGQIIQGANVENGSLGLTICAERVAACTAIVTGETAWKAIAVASCSGVTPCGACRQFLAEFAPCLPIVLIDANTNAVTQKTNLEVLLPGAFQFRSQPDRTISEHPAGSAKKIGPATLWEFD